MVHLIVQKQQTKLMVKNQWNELMVIEAVVNGEEAANGEESVERVDGDGTVVNGEQSVVEQVDGNEAMESSKGNSSQTCAVCYVPTVHCVPVPTSQCDIIRNDNSATHFYTGLPTWALFQFLLSHLIVYYSSFRNAHQKVTPANSLLMVLMRLRLNARLEDLSYRFGIAVPTVSIIIDK